MTKHEGRKHSKFSASGAERWFQCPGSVELSEGLPDKSSKWAVEGTKAHEVLERIMLEGIQGRSGIHPLLDDMYHHGQRAADFIFAIHRKHRGSDLMVETRISLEFIHSEMFGTFDGAVVDHFGTLHVFDYKYGSGKAVSPKKNLQMIFYGLGVAHRFHWNFNRVRLWIIQPRIKGYDGPLFWDMSIDELYQYVDVFKKAVKRVEQNPKLYVEGSWCHWCKAKGICPLKRAAKLEEARNVFTPIGEINGKTTEPQENAQDRSKEKSGQKAKTSWTENAGDASSEESETEDFY